ncbi:MAG: glutathione S-transferase family protein [Geminicoccaceae bacterium]
MLRLTTWRWVPPFARSHVRDLRVRWALEEAGLAYETRLIGGDSWDAEAYRREQPFGQVPVLEEDGLVLFESGAIVLHIGERSETLLPREPAARARAMAWVFAALNTIEVAVQPLAEIDFFYAEEAWAKQRRPAAQERVAGRLADLAAWLGDRPYLEGSFTAGDLMMTTVLRMLTGSETLNAHPALVAYLDRNEQRPAFRKAMADHMAVYADG